MEAKNETLSQKLDWLNSKFFNYIVFSSTSCPQGLFSRMSPRSMPWDPSIIGRHGVGIMLIILLGTSKTISKYQYLALLIKSFVDSKLTNTFRQIVRQNASSGLSMWTFQTFSSGSWRLIRPDWTRLALWSIYYRGVSSRATFHWRR